MQVDQYKVGVVDEVQISGKLRICRVNVGSDDHITVVTSAANVRQGSRLAVATVGSTFLDDEGTTQTVRKQSIGGFSSEGIFCDSYMLGWIGGARGVAAQIPDEFELGSPPPSTKPRRKDEVFAESIRKPNDIAPGLFEKKMTKEEKKKIAEERRNARKAKKQAEPRDEQGGEIEEEGA
jgi:tRNA-binding EMAP/Myf-like protein